MRWNLLFIGALALVLGLVGAYAALQATAPANFGNPTSVLTYVNPISTNSVRIVLNQKGMLIFFFNSSVPVDIYLTNNAAFTIISNANVAEGQARATATALEGRSVYEVYENDTSGIFPYQNVRGLAVPNYFFNLFNSIDMLPNGTYYVIFADPGVGVAIARATFLFIPFTALQSSFENMALYDSLAIDLLLAGTALIALSFLKPKPKSGKDVIEKQAQKAHEEMVEKEGSQQYHDSMKLDWKLPILVLVALSLSILFFSGPSPDFDDATYLVYAHQMLNGTFNITQSPYAYGTFFLWTNSITLQLFGNIGTALPQILEFVVLVCLLYVLCLKYFSSIVSFFATLCIGVSPFFFVYSTRLLPDMLLGVIVAAVMVLFAYGDGTRHEWLYFFSAGVLAGFTLFVKFGGFLPLAFILLSYAVIYMKARNVVSFCMGAGIAILLYQLMLPAGVGLVQLIGNYSALQTSLSVTTLLNNVIALLYYFFGLVPSTNLQLSGLGLIGVFAIIGIYIAFTRKDKPLEFASVSFISVLLYLFFGTQSLTHYILITVVTRYFIWFSPLLVLLTAEFFNEFRDRKDAYRIFVILLFMLLLSNLLLYVFLLWGADIVYLVTQMIQIRVLFH